MRTVPLLVLVALLPSPARGETAERARYLMGTTCAITADHSSREKAVSAIEAAFTEISRWESILSDYDDRSELSGLNASRKGEPFRCSEDLYGFLSRSLSLAAATRGAFDITVGPLVDLYAVRHGGRWPESRQIREALHSTGSGRLRLDPGSRTATFLEVGMRLDPGAIGKGLALDAATRLLRERGVAWAVLDFGGQIAVLGAGPGGCGVPVEIAPLGRDSARRTIVYLADASASTSANDERGLIVDGRPLGHILDPRTGLPADRVTSVTVVAPAGAVADALSTAFFVMGAGEPGAHEIFLRFGAEGLFTLRDADGYRTRPTPGFERLTHDRCAGMRRDFAPATDSSPLIGGGR